MTLRPAHSVPLVVSTIAAQQANKWTVGAYLPLENAAFARVLNPVRGGAVPPASWASAAGEDFIVDATTRWYDVISDASHGRPDTGFIDPGTARSLAKILRAHTTTPSECYFLAWEGYSPLRDEFLSSPRVELTPGRSMLILSGDLDDGSESVERLPFCRTPQWWLPADGAWAVGNDIYGASVYVAGTQAAINAILADRDIEAYPATSSTKVIAEEFEPDN